MYTVIKTIKNRQYVYEQTSYRVGKKVKTRTHYVGPLRAFLGAMVGALQPPSAEDRVWRAVERAVAGFEKSNAEFAAKEKALGGPKLISSETAPRSAVSGATPSEAEPPSPQDSPRESHQGDAPAPAPGLA